MIYRLGLVILLTSLFLSCAQQSQQQNEASSNYFVAKLELNDSLHLPFLIESKDSAENSFWSIRNGNERISLGPINKSLDSFNLELPVFESSFSLSKTSSGYEGLWTKYQSKSIPISITSSAQNIWQINKPSTELQGTWELHFSPNDSSNHYPAKGEFDCDENGQCTGTILTETGDYRYLVGKNDGQNFTLSTFDGAHAFLFQGNINGDHLTGTFYSGSHFSEPFTGMKNEDFKLRSASSLTFLKEGYDKIEFKALNLNGDSIHFPQDFSSTKVNAIQILGTWCPNCMDETKLLVNLEARYPELSILGLAFERTTDTNIAFPNIRKMRSDLEVSYPVYLTGTWSKSEAAKKLPMLNAIISYPTLILMDEDLNVKYIHTGFNGPGTGAEYEKTKQEIIEEIEAIIK